MRAQKRTEAITTRVPPPYVPPLFGKGPNMIAVPGGMIAMPVEARAPDPIPAPEAEVAAQPITQPIPNQNKASLLGVWGQKVRAIFGKLSVREKLLSGMLALALFILPVLLPQTGLDTSGLGASASAQAIEKPAENFPGSAFYFIDPNYAIPQNYGAFGADMTTGQGSDPAALLPDAETRNYAERPSLIPAIAFNGSMTDNQRALRCLTLAIYYESATEPDLGQEAVAQVVLNRVRHPSYPNTVCGVVFQGSERRTGCQFSFTCDGAMARTPSAFYWRRAMAVASRALAGNITSPVGTATHYHTTEIYPYWAPSLKFLGTIGAHRFYSWKGSAGLASAFTDRYRGGEPMAAPKPRSASADDISPILDPIALEKAYEAGRKKAEAEAAKQEAANAAAADNARRHNLPIPGASDTMGTTKYRTPDYSRESQQKGGDSAYAGQKLPGVSQIKPEFENAGSWKVRPGS
jgi:spore germination cell wall hydrolase CwlJ-like protein